MSKAAYKNLENVKEQYIDGENRYMMERESLKINQRRPHYYQINIQRKK
ncbi:MAG: hypothetical protein ACLRTR_07825 [Clostridia bacterium]